MITWESICKAVDGMKTVSIKGKDYVQVTERIKAFRQVCPGGCIATDIIELTEDRVVMRATVSDEDGKVLGTGMAFEMRDSSYINKTSFVENCETSAVGRALGMVAIGVDASMASAEELVNALKGQERIKEQEATQQTRGQAVKAWISAHGISMESFGNWRNAAVANEVIPDRRINDLSEAEYKALLKFVEANIDGG